MPTKIQIIIAIVPIIISLITLKQTSKQIEDSTRPYLTFYHSKVNLGQPRNILILKNFESSAATINSISYDDSLMEVAYVSNLKPFSSTIGTTIAPGQSYKCEIKSAPTENFIVNFKISYTSLSNKTYNESMSLKLDANRGNIQQRVSTKDKDINKIFLALQEMIEQDL